MNDPSTMNYYPRSLIRSLRLESQRFDEIITAAIAVEETVSLIMNAARAGNWKEADSLYHEILNPRSYCLQGTRGYTEPDDLKTDLEAIEHGFSLRRLDELEQALEAVSAAAAVAREQADEDGPGEEGSDWACY